jgi:thiol-disulfide isomerase/thioredoxin
VKRMFKDWGLAVLIAAVVFLVVGLVQDGPEVPDDAPAFTLADLSGGEVSLSEYEGRTLVLNFWASWCGPCKQEIPEFARFHAAHPEIAMLGVAVDSGDTKAVKRAAKRFGIPYDVAMGTKAMVGQYGVNTLPTTVIIGPDGQVLDVVVGLMDHEDLLRAVR